LGKIVFHSIFLGSIFSAVPCTAKKFSFFSHNSSMTGWVVTPGGPPCPLPSANLNPNPSSKNHLNNNKRKSIIKRKMVP